MGNGPKVAGNFCLRWVSERVMSWRRRFFKYLFRKRKPVPAVRSMLFPDAPPPRSDLKPLALSTTKRATPLQLPPGRL